MKRRITIADLEKSAAKGTDTFLYCIRCHGEFSSYPGDYSYITSNHVFKCGCRGKASPNLRLVRRYTWIEECV
jgi:hypothetical protein